MDDLIKRLERADEYEPLGHDAWEAATALTEANATIARLEAENARLREALKPSGETKAAYMGEINDPETKRMVSWTAIKMVMAMISTRAALSNTPRTAPPE